MPPEMLMLVNKNLYSRSNVIMDITWSPHCHEFEWFSSFLNLKLCFTLTVFFNGLRINEEELEHRPISRLEILSLPAFYYKSILILDKP